MRLLHEAIAIDPSHAPAHASLAACLSLLGYNGMAPARVVYPQAKVSAQRAVDLDPQSCLGYSNLGFVKLVYDWDFEGASACFERALEVGPNNENTLLTHAMYLLWVHGDKPRALAQVRTALAIDPVSPFTNSMAPWIMVMAFEWEEAARLAEHALRMYPDAPQPATALAWAHACRGRLAEATAIFEAAASKSSDPMTQGFLGHVYGLAGRTDDAQRILDRLKQSDPTGHTSAKGIVAVLSGMGDIDGAFEWIDRGIAERDGGLLSLRASPPFIPLASDPRFEAAARRMGLPPRDGHVVTQLRARPEAGERFELEVDASPDAAQTALVRELAEAVVGPCHCRAGRSRPRHLERHVVLPDEAREHPRLCRPEARHVARVPRVRRRRQQRRPRRVGHGRLVAVGAGLADRGDRPPQPVDELARERRQQRVVVRHVQQREDARRVEPGQAPRASDRGGDLVPDHPERGGRTDAGPHRRAICVCSAVRSVLFTSRAVSSRRDPARTARSSAPAEAPSESDGRSAR